MDIIEDCSVPSYTIMLQVTCGHDSPVSMSIWMITSLVKCSVVCVCMDVSPLGPSGEPHLYLLRLPQYYSQKKPVYTQLFETKLHGPKTCVLV